MAKQPQRLFKRPVLDFSFLRTDKRFKRMDANTIGVYVKLRILLAENSDFYGAIKYPKTIFNELRKGIEIDDVLNFLTKNRPFIHYHILKMMEDRGILKVLVSEAEIDEYNKGFQKMEISSKNGVLTLSKASNNDNLHGCKTGTNHNINNIENYVKSVDFADIIIKRISLWITLELDLLEYEVFNALKELFEAKIIQVDDIFLFDPELIKNADLSVIRSFSASKAFTFSLFEDFTSRYLEYFNFVWGVDNPVDNLPFYVDNFFENVDNFQGSVDNVLISFFKPCFREKNAGLSNMPAHDARALFLGNEGKNSFKGKLHKGKLHTHVFLKEKKQNENEKNKKNNSLNSNLTLAESLNLFSAENFSQTICNNVKNVSEVLETYLAASKYSISRERVMMANGIPSESVLREWGNAFNLYQLIVAVDANENGEVFRSETEWVKHFTNWLRLQDKNRDPKMLHKSVYENSKKECVKMVQEIDAEIDAETNEDIRRELQMRKFAIFVP